MTIHAEEPKTKNNAGNRIALLGVALIFGIVLIAAFILLSRQSENAGDETATMPSPAPTAVNANQDKRASPQQAREIAASPNAVAIVNDHVIDMATARVTLASDRAMARLLGQPTSDETDILERLINRELLLQAATAADFDKSPTEVDKALADFLARQNRTSQALQEALAAEGLSMDDFTSYFGDLLIADAFSRTQAEKNGMTPAAYIDQLQADARISYGPAAGVFLLEAASESKSAGKAAATPPASTPETVVAASPTPVPPAASPAPEVGLSPGQTAPDFTLPLVNDPQKETLRLSDLRGGPVVLSFWTTWCPYCRVQTPVLVTAYQKYADQGVQLVGVDVKDDRSQVEAYLAEHGINYPVVLDAKGDAAKQYEVQGFPTTYFIDDAGRIVAVKVGALTPEQLEGYLQKLSD